MTSPASQIFHCALPGSAPLLRALRELGAGPSRTRGGPRQRIIHDTADALLRQAGAVLWFERCERLPTWTLCVSGAADGGSDPARWQWRGGELPDFAAAPGPDMPKALRVLCKALRKDGIGLQAIFTVQRHVRQWTVTHRQYGDFQITLSRTTLRAGERRQTVCELDVTADAATHLPAVVAALGQHAPLLPGPYALLAHGYALHRQTPPEAVRALPLPLAAQCTAAQAFVRITRNCLGQFLDNRAVALVAPDDPEPIHQMRVALRRLRAALRLFRPSLTPALRSALLPLHDIMRALARTRDLDVLLDATVCPVIAAHPTDRRLARLAQALEQRRQEAHAQVLTALDSLSLCARLRALQAQLDDATLGPETARPAFDYAETRLAQRLRTLRRAARQAIGGDASTWHALRTRIKALRYAEEFFAPLRPDKAQRKLHAQRHAQLSALQECLGALNDLTSAGPTLDAVAADDGELREAVSLLGGWHLARYPQLRAEAAKQIHALAASGNSSVSAV